MSRVWNHPKACPHPCPEPWPGMTQRLPNRVHTWPFNVPGSLTVWWPQSHQTSSIVAQDSKHKNSSKQHRNQNNRENKSHLLLLSKSASKSTSLPPHSIVNAVVSPLRYKGKENRPHFLTGEDSKDLEVFFFQPPQGHSKKVHRIFIRNKKKDIDTDISSLKIIRNIVKNLIPINFKTKSKIS